jgi:DamX protein
LGESLLIDAVNALTASLNSEIAISKIFLPPMTLEQTTGYLDCRLAAAGYVGKRLFSASAVKKIHRLSGGLPGRINTMADQQLKDNFSEEKQRQKGFFSWIQKYEKALNWSAAGLAVLIVSLFLVFYYTGNWNSSSDNLGLAQRVFRGKIELPAGFEKAPLMVAETLSSEKHNSDSTTLEIRTGEVPAILSPNEKMVEIASAPPEAIGPQTQARSEGAVVTEQSSVPGTALEKENAVGKAVYREKWLLSQNSSYYTIQILGVQDEKRLLNFIESRLAATQMNLAYYQTSYKGKDWYPLLYGVYASHKEASSAMKELPTHIKKSSPWIRNSHQNNRS